MRINNSLRTLFVINSIFVFASQLLSPLYAIYVQKFGNGVVLAGTSVSVLLLSSTLFLALISKWGSAVKEKEHMLAVGYLLRAIGWFAYIVISDAFSLIMLQILFGLGEALGTPAFSAIFAEHVNKKDNVEKYADWSIISNTIMALAAVLGGVLVNSFGFNILFIVMSIMAFVSFVSVVLLPRNVL